MHLLAKRFVFWGWWSGFSDRGSQDLSDGTNVAEVLARELLDYIQYDVYKLNENLCLWKATCLSRDDVHVCREFLGHQQRQTQETLSRLSNAESRVRLRSLRRAEWNCCERPASNKAGRVCTETLRRITIFYNSLQCFRTGVLFSLFVFSNKYFWGLVWPLGTRDQDTQKAHVSDFA